MSVTRSLRFALIAPLAACQGEPQPEPSEQALQNFVKSVEAAEDAGNKAAVAEARVQERERSRAAEERLDEQR